MRRLNLISGPECYPVTLAEVKAQRNRADSLDDDYLTGCIKALTEHAQAVTNQQLVSAVYETTVESWTSGQDIELPRPPLQSVISITSVDNDGAETILAESAYEVVTDTIVGFVRPAYGETWPDERFLIIRYTTGYPTTGSPAVATTPAPIKSWMLARVGTMDVFRETIIAGQTVGQLPRDFVDCLLDVYIVPEVA